METRHESEMIKESKPLKVEVLLHDQDSDTTRTKFFFDGAFQGYGLEDEFREVKVKGETRIPNGEYSMALRHSPKFSGEYYRDDQGNLLKASLRKTGEQRKRYYKPHELIWVKDVPNFMYILWHWGNFESNTDGCYLVGSTLFTDKKRGRAVGASRKMYEKIYPILWRAIKGRGAYVIYDR